MTQAQFCNIQNKITPPVANPQLEKIILLIDWTKKKVETHFTERGSIHFHEREIWWASIGENIGSEINGKNCLYERSIIVMKKFSNDTMLAMPCTTKLKNGSWYHPFSVNGMERRAVISQVRTISNRRLIRRLGNVSPDEFLALQMAMFRLFKTDPPT